ncbi:hypothetical protein Tco_0767471 [Tanacetum coccineum]
MDLCTNLQIRVLDLENIKTSQRMEIDSLKRRVKRLEKKGRSRTHKLKRLYKVSLTARVDSSKEEEVLGEDASKQERINDIDEDEDITLVSVQDDADAEMFDVGTLTGKEVVVVEEINKRRNVVDEVAKVIKTAQVSVVSAKVSSASATTTTTTTEDDLTLAQLLDKGLSQDKGKGILVEPEKPLKKKDQLKLDEEIALKLQAEFDEEERIIRAEEEKIDEANIAWDDIQAKVDADYQLAERLEAKEQEIDLVEEEVAIDAIPLATKSLSIVGWKIHKEGKKSYYQIITADGKPVEDMDYLLWNDMKIMFEPYVEDEIWKLQQGYKVLEWKILRINEVFGIILLVIMELLMEKLDDFGVTAALIDVSVAQSKLVLLENFNEKYSKCLRLLVKLQLVNAASEEVSTAKLVSTVYVICMRYFGKRYV